MRTLVPTTEQIVKQFQAGRSMADIAKRMLMPREDVELAIRRWLYVQGPFSK